MQIVLLETWRTRLFWSINDCCAALMAEKEHAVSSSSRSHRLVAVYDVHCKRHVLRWGAMTCLQQRVEGVGGAHGVLAGRAFQLQLRREAQRCSGTQQDGAVSVYGLTPANVRRCVKGTYSHSRYTRGGGRDAEVIRELLCR